jgi:acetamidase/formamidase
MRKFLSLFFVAALSGAAHAATYHLDATPNTVAWGNYDAARAPVLHIKSGDTVVFRTLLTNSPAGLAKAGVKDADIEQALKDVFDKVPLSARGPGGHILNGPVYIDGAEPGDTLEIRIDKIELAIPYAYNALRFGAGLLTVDFPFALM